MTLEQAILCLWATLVVLQQVGGKDGRVQEGDDRDGGRENCKRRPGKGNHEPRHGGCGEAGHHRLSDDNPVVVVGNHQPDVEQAESTEEAGGGEEWLGILLTDELQGHREQADAKEDEVVEVDHQIAGFLSMVFVNEVVKLNDVGEKEVDHADEDEDGKDRQVGLGEVVRNPHDGFAKHQDDQGRQPLQEVGEDDRAVPGVLPGEGRPNPGDNDPNQGDGDADAIGGESPDQKGDRAQAEDQRKRPGDLAVNLIPGLMVDNQVLETQG